MKLSFATLRKQLPAIASPRACLLALGFLACAALVRAPLPPALNERLPPYLTIYPAVVLSSFTGGMRVGAGAALLGGVIAWFLWIAPSPSFELPPYPIFVLISYVVAMSITVATCGLGRLLLDHVSALEAARSAQAKETVHRIKNLIAVIQAIAFKVSRRSSTQNDFRRDFSARMQALGSAQNMLLEAEWTDIDMEELVRSALAPFLPNPALQLEVGPALRVPARFVGGLCLALYELATNAIKYGALHARSGKAQIYWEKNDGCGVLIWLEISDEVQDVALHSSGLGSGLIEHALMNAPGTNVVYDRGPAGVRAEFLFPCR